MTGDWRESLGKTLGAWNGKHIVASPDVDGLLSAALLRRSGFPKAEVCGFYTTQYLLIFAGFDAADCRRALWLDHDISDPGILCIGQHLLQHAPGDRLPRRNARSFNPNFHFGQAWSASFKGKSGTTRDKYPFGTCHMLMHLCGEDKILASEGSLPLLAHADGSFVNVFRYPRNVEIWRELMFPNSAIMEAIVHGYMTEENRLRHAKIVSALEEAGATKSTQATVRKPLPPEWRRLEGRQSIRYAKNSVPSKYLEKVNRIINVLRQKSMFSLPPVMEVGIVLTGEAKKFIPENIKAGEFDKFMEDEKIFSHVISGQDKIKYTRLSGGLRKIGGSGS